ncbi:hypothetical protein GCM10010129_06380 [Streptomyces fumigatiscleroticus]|nr:hypothetical protein GCM10010129_06380 [Streptomyces fumigatiscleroticus]
MQEETDDGKYDQADDSALFAPSGQAVIVRDVGDDVEEQEEEQHVHEQPEHSPLNVQERMAVGE